MFITKFAWSGEPALKADHERTSSVAPSGIAMQMLICWTSQKNILYLSPI